MIEPVKLGLKLEPSAILFVYKMWGRLRMRTMPLRNLWPTTSTKFILEDIRTRHEILLEVPDDSIIRMIEILKASKGGMELTTAIAKFNQEASQNEDDPKKAEERPKMVEDGPKNAEKGDGVENGSRKNDKPYSFMDKRLADEDTDFDPNDDLPLDDLDGHSDDEFWR